VTSIPALPTLRSNLKFVPRISDGEPAGYIVKNPDSGKIFEFGEEENFLFRQLDGRTPLHEIQRRFEASFEKALSFKKLEAFIRQLSTEGFLVGPDGSHVQNDFPSLIQHPGWTKWKLGNPDRFLGWLVSHLDWCFTKTFVIGCLGITVFAIVTLVANRRTFLSELIQITHPMLFVSVFAMWIFFLNLPSELVKGLTCKHYGGQVRTFGIRLAYYHIPQFYFDVGDSRTFRDKRKRVWTLSAGVFYILIAWTFAVIGWKVMVNWASVHTFLLHLTVTTSLGILININPLAQRPGYFLLNSWLSVANLRERAIATATAWVSFRPAPEPLTRREKRVFRSYGLLLIVYLITVAGMIVYFAGGYLTGQYNGTGALVFMGWILVMYQRPVKQRLGSSRAMQWIKEKTGRLGPRRFLKYLIWGGLIGLLFVPYPYDTGGSFRFLPPTQTEVRALVSGEIQQVYVTEGQWVNKDQPMALQSTRAHQKDLDTAQASLDEKKAKLALVKSGAKPEQVDKAKQQVERARVKLEYDTKEANRLKGLYEQGVVSEEDYDNAAKIQDVDREQLDVAKAELKLVIASFRPEEIDALEADVRRLQTEVEFYKQNVQLTKILSPVGGQVVTPYLSNKIGQDLKEGNLFAVIQDAKTIQAEVQVPEGDVGEVSVGAKVKVKTWAYPSNVFMGSVSLIAPVAETQSSGNVVRVMTDISNPDLLLKPEMTGYAKIETGWKPVGVVLSRLLYRFFMVEVWYWIP
jgi:multidrug resistance efflux pump